MADKWDGGLQYNAGDEVTHHGVTYRAKTPINNPLIAPYSREDHPHWEKVEGRHKAEEPKAMEPAESPATSTKA